jgi:hypothetical protein
MKRLFTFLICLSLLIGSISAQTPSAFKYQAVVRDNAGQIIINKSVGFRISILQTSATGSAVYSEKHVAQTNAFGLVNLEIGNGTKLSGTFSTIDWGTGSYFVKIELDASNNGAFSEMGTSQLLAVPYSMYAGKAGNGLNLSSTPKAGDILINNGLGWDLLSKGINGQTLRVDNGTPKWGEPGYALPMVTTNVASDVLQTGATSGGNVIATGYSDITARGVCWSTNQNPTIADGKTSEPVGIGTFTSILTGLVANTTYYVRAYATNSAGTAYGNQVSLKTFLTVVFPTVTTAAAINVSENAATSGGNVTATGGAEVTAKGLCWGTNQNPTISDNKTIDGNGTGQFASQMTKLVQGTTYYVRAYAGNSAGIGYGDQVTLTTLKTIPTVVTKNITSISATGAVSGGTITISGGGTISDKGICWGESENPTIDDNKVSAGSGTSAFNSAISLLKPNSTCYVRAYAINEIGIAYGAQKSFITLDAFYDGFETGFSGTTGGWGITIENAVEGAYSLTTRTNNSEASLTRTLTNSGQVTFYAKTSGAYGSNITFYIDNVAQGTYFNTYWGLQSYPVTNGVHTFKWKSSFQYNDAAVVWIDLIVMPK